ncbi:MAG: tyrosine recombinase XerC [Eubacteriales bacterium]|nr:tyrosine recombinase XerC [Eubacteriales bacterium]
MEATPQVIIQFLSYKEVIQNRSPLTVSEYHHDLDMFFRYLLNTRKSEKTDLAVIDGAFINSVTTEDIYAFLLYLAHERKVSAKTMARKLSALKAFFKYHTSKSKLVENNPAKDIDAPSIKQSLPKFLSLDESVDLLEAVDRAEPFYARDYCILTLFLNCGMRLSELVGINLSDIDSDMKKLRVTGKGRKMRVIYLNSACRAAIEYYIPARNETASKCSVPVKQNSKNALFLSKRNQRISTKTVQWLVKKYLGRADMGDKGYSVHKLRHTAATLMYNQGGVDVRTLKDILGHEQLNTTQIYTHVSDKNLEKAMDANPLAGINKTPVHK